MSEVPAGSRRPERRPVATGRITVGSAGEAIASQLRARILSGEIAVGSLLPTERDLAQESGLSRGSVREALKTLALEGLVSTKIGRNGGYFVQEPPSDAVVRTLDVFIRGRRVDQQSLLEMREIIEPQCATLAARRRSPEALERLTTLTERMAHLVEDIPTFLDLNIDWHVGVAEASMNEVLASVMQAISTNIRTAIAIDAFASPDMMRAAQRLHERVLTAIAVQDAEAAYRRMRRHLDETYDVVRGGHERRLHNDQG